MTPRCCFLLTYPKLGAQEGLHDWLLFLTLVVGLASWEPDSVLRRYHQAFYCTSVVHIIIRLFLFFYDFLTFLSMCFFVWAFGVEGAGTICEESRLLFLLLARPKEDCGKGDAMSVLLLHMADLEETLALGLGSICPTVTLLSCSGFWWACSLGETSMHHHNSYSMQVTRLSHRNLNLSTLQN